MRFQDGGIAARTDAVAEAGISVVAEVGFHLLPVLMVADALAVVGGQRSLQMADGVRSVKRRRASGGATTASRAPHAHDVIDPELRKALDSGRLSTKRSPISKKEAFRRFAS